ncbi:TIGR00180 family glycosyltransferase [Candidatus Fonsibacter ubiquis]|uniref:TIGR00180 family glycosyltransferase n=1 Tax=Candidatus Fonsibacter ubiquis TaxID=1925548 RepID=UPI000C087F41|nr:TIGR00180 family glycosyltransferase [Candidatus Fonsibacter ubiquis]
MIEDKLTVLVLLKERPYFTKRLINFFIKENLKYDLFFADGGKKSIFNEDLKILKKEKVKFTYKKFRYDKNLETFIKKISISLNLVTTKYVMLFDNDDIPIKFTINRCLLKLEKNKYLSACGGYLINFQLMQHLKKNYQHKGHMINFAKMKYGNYYNSNDKYKRLRNYFIKNDINTYNDIFRTKYLRKTYSVIQKFKFNYLYFYFILADAVNYYNGKIIKLNLPFAFHQSHQDSYGVKESIYDVIDNKIFCIEKKIFYKNFNKIFGNEKIFSYLKKYFEILERKKLLNKPLKTKNNNLFFYNFDQWKYLLKKLYKPFVYLSFSFRNNHFDKFSSLYKNNSLKKEIVNIFLFLKKF